MQLSIIILNYNVRYFLELCVLSVQNAIQNLDAEIIVIDNNSLDDSCEMMKQRFPNVKLIENKENSGFPKGNNIGVAEAQGEYICILNPDRKSRHVGGNQLRGPDHRRERRWIRCAGAVACGLRHIQHGILESEDT